MGRTLFDKIWDTHVVARRPDGKDLVYMDRTVIDEVRAPYAFGQIEAQGRAVRRPDLTVMVQDHLVATRENRDDTTNPDAIDFIRQTRAAAKRHGVRLHDVNDPDQGISHVVAPEFGYVLPGATHASADSHAPTVGGLGAIGFGCGATDLAHLLATQVMPLHKPKTLRVQLDGRLRHGVSAKDVVLHAIGILGVEGARGHAVEYTGNVVDSLPIEGRLTICNMAVEMGGRTALVAPDDATFAWLSGKPAVPKRGAWDEALAFWRTLRTDEGASYDRQVAIACDSLEPQVTWGTNPGQVMSVGDRISDPASLPEQQRSAALRALDYMGLTPGSHIEGTKIDRVFIGSCTNAWLPDLVKAAEVVRGRRLAPHVKGLVVPGSTTVRRDAEALGLDRVFKDAGFMWGESGCSMCAGGNGDRAATGERCLSTSNRNFEGRQGRNVRTHLASPAMVAAAGIAGQIVDVRKWMPGGT